MRISSFASSVLLAGGLFCLSSTWAQNATQNAVQNAIQRAVLSDGGAPTMPKKPVMFDLTSLDKTADPCSDFYQYACGNWMKNNPIPASETRWGSFNTLAETNNYKLYQELKTASQHPATALQTKYGNYFAACMDTAAADKAGAKPIEPELQMISGLEDKKNVTKLILALEQRNGSGPLLGVRVAQDQKDSSQQILATGQGGLALPDRDYYLLDDERMTTIRKQYVEHVTKMFVLLGDSQDAATQEANDVMRIETELAKGSMARVEMRNPANIYHIMTIDQAQALTPDFDWHVYLNGLGVGGTKTLNVASPGYAKTVNAEIEAEPLSALKSYMRWHQLHDASAYLSENFVRENFEFFNKTLNGQQEQQPRWKRCTRLTDRALGEAVGQDWVKQNFPPNAKDNMEKLVAALRKALDEDIQQLSWMSPETKKQAELKLVAFRQKIGYPEHWRDYSKLTVSRTNFFGNLSRATIFENQRNLGKLGKPVDETEWGMTPPTVNAYYNPPQNDINFPAGILQPPFYDNKLDPAVNFGGIGVVIGHEMTHGFDDQGSKFGPTGNVKYNADGSLGSWFTPEDQTKFNDRTKCVSDEYGAFEVAPGEKQNGKLTLGENTADNGGIRIAFQALQEVLLKQGVTDLDGKQDVIEGYTPAQRFFISFGQVWCENRTEQTARVSARTDPHSAGKWRTDGTVQNFPEFGKAFGCKVGQAMMPEKACRVW